MDHLAAYIPIDRRLALAGGYKLPEYTRGAALLADVSGFTILTRRLVQELGRKQGAETLLTYINPVYEQLIHHVHQYRGCVVGFAGDAVTCWFDEVAGLPAALRAVACGLAIQTTMQSFATQQTLQGTPFQLSVKVAVASGPARRLLVGDPGTKVLDVVAGAALNRVAQAEMQARPGEVVASREVVAQLGAGVDTATWRNGKEVAVLAGLSTLVAPSPWLELPADALTAEQIRPWLLPEVYERAQIGGEYRGDLRAVTPLLLSFGDIDFDHDAEAARKLDAYIRWVQAVIHRHGGTLLQLTIGDKGNYIYAPFGAPSAHEDDTRRALATALALQSPPAGLGWRPSVRIGLTRGEVWTGAYGAPARHTYGAIGREVGLAARLMVQAQPGQVLVSGRPAATAGFKFAYLGEWRYKGFGEPLATHELQGEQLSGTQVFYDLMVGRDAELQQLVDFAQPLFAARLAGVVIICGEAGIGKSRLAYALRESLGQRVSWFSGQTDQILQQAFNPFVYWLKRYFEQVPEASPAENRARFEARLAQVQAALQQSSLDVRSLAAELDRTRSFLGALLGLQWPGSLYERLSEARLRHENTLIALKTLLLAESCLRPVVLELEDGHWLDAASRELLLALSRNVAAYPLLFIVTARYADDGSRPAFELAPDVPVFNLDLGALATEALERQASALLDDPPAPDLLTLLREHSRANPFFAQQILYYLQENHLLVRTAEGTWVLAAGSEQPGTGVQIPDTLNTVLVARLDRLAHEVREVVQAAAVVGREFEAQVLARMLQGEVLPHIRRAEQEQIWTALAGLRYLFKHALMRDAAYEMQLHAHLRDLHRLAAEAYEQLYVRDLRPYYAELTYHYGRAGIADRERQYARLAGEHAAAQYRNQAALKFLSRALELTPKAEPETRYALLLAREAVHALLSEHPAQQADLAELAALTEDLTPLQQVTVVLRQAAYYESQDETDEALAVLQQGLAIVDALDSAAGRKQRALLEKQWGSILWKQGHYLTARDHVEEARQILEQEGEVAELGKALGLLGQIYAVGAGTPVEASALLAQALPLHRRFGDRMSETSALNGLGNAAYLTGNLSLAAQYYQEALAVEEEIGYRFGAIYELLNLGVVARSQGEYVAARAYYQRALYLTREIGDQGMEGEVLLRLGRVAADLGAWPLAQAYARQALDLACAIRDRRFESEALWNVGESLVEQNPVQAVEYVRRAFKTSAELEDPHGRANALRTLGYLAYRLGQYARAQEHLRDAAVLFASIEFAVEVAENNALLAEVLWAADDLTGAQNSLAEILAHWQADPAFTGMFHPFRTYLSCYKVLQAVHDPRAGDVLRTAYQELQTRADKIADETERRSFLENVAEHREIQTVWQAAPRTSRSSGAV